MPANGVHEALRRMAEGRIIRADHGSFEALDEEVDQEARRRRAWREFRGRVKFGGKFPKEAKRENLPLYVEYSIPL